jgi:hypothetical protein
MRIKNPTVFSSSLSLLIVMQQSRVQIQSLSSPDQTLSVCGGLPPGMAQDLGLASEGQQSSQKISKNSDLCETDSQQ